jgi:hypothetical protein
MWLWRLKSSMTGHLHSGKSSARLENLSPWLSPSSKASEPEKLMLLSVQDWWPKKLRDHWCKCQSWNNRKLGVWVSKVKRNRVSQLQERKKINSSFLRHHFVLAWCSAKWMMPDYLEGRSSLLTLPTLTQISGNILTDIPRNNALPVLRNPLIQWNWHLKLTIALGNLLSMQIFRPHCRQIEEKSLGIEPSSCF